MAQENQKNNPSVSKFNGFSYEVVNDFFEVDNHLEISGLPIERIAFVPGKVAGSDIYLVIYKGSPNISIYNAQGKLVDIDHYLPDGYKTSNDTEVENMLSTLPDFSITEAKNPKKLAAYIKDVLQMGEGDFFAGVNYMLGMNISGEQLEQFVDENGKEDGLSNVHLWVKKKYPDFLTFLRAYLTFMHRDERGYVEVTAEGNIIITPVLRNIGLAIIIETKNARGELMKPSRWNIVRTKFAKELEQALIFRTNDVKAYFDIQANTVTKETLRYKLYEQPKQLWFDSLLDDTENLLKVNLFNNCYQILAADEEVIVVLSSEREATIVNAHRSIVPQKWARKILLKFPVKWVRADQNLHMLFVQTENGNIAALDIYGEEPTKIADFGNYKIGFEIDQFGSIIVTNELGKLIKIITNVNELENASEKKGVHAILKDISHLFEGDQLFSKKQFAKVLTVDVNEKKATKVAKVSPVMEKVRFDFETNVEHQLSEAGTDYDALIKVKESIALARLNLSDELTTAAEKEGILLIGQKLNKLINGIILPVEERVNDLVEFARSAYVLKDTESLVNGIKQLKDPYAFRDILNKVRAYKEEFEEMHSDAAVANYKLFLNYQNQINKGFASQMATDNSNLKKFITGEIEQIRKEITQTHDPRQLETLLGTHPAALELMNILKQPYVLRTIAKDQTYSPAAIQKRLFDLIKERKRALQEANEKVEMERKAAKEQLALMTQKSIDFFVENHSGGFSLMELSTNPAYQQLLKDFKQLDKDFSDLRLSNELRRRLERRILERTRTDLEKIIAFEGKYAFIQNDPDLYVDIEGIAMKYPTWSAQIIEKKGVEDVFQMIFVRNSDYQVYRPSVQDNLTAGGAFEIDGGNFSQFWDQLKIYSEPRFSKEYLDALWKISRKESTTKDFPQFAKDVIKKDLPTQEVDIKSLRCALEIKIKEWNERTRIRNVPEIAPDFVDETPYFKAKLQEFIVKSKLQLASGTGIVLLSGPPGTGKSTFLKFAAKIMNREYFEHAADKWQTKNSLITAIKFGEFGPYATPASFTRAITTPHSLINIEEIKEWPEALRKALNPFFGGSKIFMAADGTRYDIGENILLCAAANLGSIYRQEDEPFTADFWSRIEVVEYDYAPEKVDNGYIHQLFAKSGKPYLTVSEMVQSYFDFDNRPELTKDKASYFAKKFVEFILLPKADERVKRNNLQNFIEEYFRTPSAILSDEKFSPEEAAKIVIKRVKALSSYAVADFFDLYNHVINGEKLRSYNLRVFAKANIEQFEQIRIQLFIIRYVEGCLRYLRAKFYASAGQTEIEGTNREFIKCVLLMDLMGRM